MPDSLTQYVGYYDWEGLPCQIRIIDADSDTVEAVIYAPGHGFQRTSLVDVIFKAEPISEQEFKRRIVAISASRRNKQQQ